MPCVHTNIRGFGCAIINIPNPSERVRMSSGKVLELEWHDYCGPVVVKKYGGVRMLSGKELRDPAVDAWITKNSNGAKQEQP